MKVIDKETGIYFFSFLSHVRWMNFDARFVVAAAAAIECHLICVREIL